MCVDEMKITNNQAQLLGYLGHTVHLLDEKTFHENRKRSKTKLGVRNFIVMDIS